MELKDVRILVVDDDLGQRSVLRTFLADQGMAVMTAESGQDALRIIAETPVDMVVTDVRMPGMSGLELLQRIRENRPALPVLLVTAFPYVKDAVDAMRDGAVDYLEKPIEFEELRASVSRALGIVGNKTERSALILPEGVIAESPAMRRLLKEVRLVAASDSRILISGESGTGKEVVADLVHAWSARSGKPFVRVNCAALNDNLLESELFGHEKGAFTGASSRRHGRFEEADSGTILLDEIGETSDALQAKLLRVIQEGVFQRVGSNEDVRVDVRIIASTNRHLEKLVSNGGFREDLFYRLNVIELYLPPLRERPEDVLPLAHHFAQSLSGQRTRISNAAVTALMSHDWPGNVRELRNAMERAVLMAQGNVIMPEHLPHRITGDVAEAPDAAADEGRMESMERVLILQTLKEHDFNRSKAAHALGISRRALIYKIQRYAEQGFNVGE